LASTIFSLWKFYATLVGKLVT